MLYSDHVFYSQFGFVSLFLDEEQITQSAYYIANFYLQTKSKSISTLKEQIDMHNKLALLEEYNRDFERAYKIMDSARKVAASAGAADIPELEKIN